MINIENKANCCGCNACGDVCSKQAITFKKDLEGFWYPEVDIDRCVDCGLCEMVCPCLKLKQPKQPIQVYAGINPEKDVREESSSGGMFWLFVRQTIDEGGLVFGAAFNKDWEVLHSSATTEVEAVKFRGSKYVQSQMNGCYKEIQEALKKGRKVLFSGTGCQVNALKSFLRKEYDNLTTVEVVCHGVPSPGIWRDYIGQLSKGKRIKDIFFRDKTNGWRNYDFLVKYVDGGCVRESYKRNLYMQGYLHDLYLRPSCHICNFKAGRSGSDITIWDFWGIENALPNLDDNKGVTLIMVNTQRGFELLKNIHGKLIIVDYEKAIACNPCIIKATSESGYRSVFMNNYQSGDVLSAISDALKQMQPSIIKLFLRRVKQILYK